MIRPVRALGVLVAILVALIQPVTLPAQSRIAGAWEGAIHAAGQDIPFQVTFKAEKELTAAIDIQGVHLPLANVRAEGTSVHFELPAGPGLAVFEGTLKGDAIAGPFTQGLATGTFEMKRKAATPATPEPPPPYKQEEVKIANGAITLAGTLTLPPTAGRHPAVVMITGSGAENRDEEVFGFKVFRVIADHLTRQGIAVLRCDDRGVGGTNGSTAQSTSDDFATDVVAQVNFLKTRPDIDRAHIGVIGHSEGGLIGPLAATKSSDIAFEVLLSGPAMTGEKILLLQGERILKAKGAPQALLDKQRETQRKLFEATRKNAGWDDLAKSLMAEAEAQVAQLPEAQRKAALQATQAQIAAQMKGVQSPWFRFFLDYDPVPALEKLRCPVLALFGELDLQVPSDENLPAMQQAFARGGNKDATVKLLPKANHLYQAAKTGDPSEYTVLPKEFVPELLPLVTTWIRQHAGMKAGS